MKVIQALKNGLQTVFAEGKIILLIYSVNFCLTLVVAIPMFSILNNSFGDSLVREQMLEAFDYDWWTEFDVKSEGIAESFRPSMIGLGLLFENAMVIFRGDFATFGLIIFLVGLINLITNTFLAGGAIGTFADERHKFSRGRFFSYCGQYFNHFFSLFLMSVILYFVVYKLLGALVLNLVGGVSGGLATERDAFFVNLIGFAIVFSLLWFVNMLFDYAKAVVVLENRESSAEALWIATKFVFRHLGKSLGLYYVIGVAGFAILVVLLAISSSFGQRTLGTIIVAFFLQQTVVLAKVWVRMNLYAAQLDFYHQEQNTMRRLPKA